MVVGPDLGIARESGLDAGEVLLRRGDALASDVERQARLLEFLGRGELALCQPRLTLEVGLGVELLAQSRLDLLALDAPLRAQAADVGARRLEVGLDAGQRQAIGLVVELEQELAARHGLVLLHRHFDDDAAQFGGDQRAVAFDIGVVGADVAASRQPGEQRHDQRDGRQQPHEGSGERTAGHARSPCCGNRDRWCHRTQLPWLQMLSVSHDIYRLPEVRSGQPGGGHGS